MGKDSLIKSTAKKKSDKEKKPKKTTTKASPKKAAKTKAPKSAAKKKATTKSTPKSTVKKTQAKPKAKPKTKPKAKATAQKTAKKLTTKELLLKSFAPISKVAKPQSMTTPKTKTPSAPPIVSASDPEEAARIRGLLLQTYDMAEVKASAKAPVVKSEPGAVKPPIAKPAGKATQAAAPAPSVPPTITTELPPETPPDPVSKAAKMFAFGVGLIILLVFMISYNNSSKYYIQPKDKAIEIWKGRFSPKDKQFFMVLHGTQLSEQTKNVYSKAEVFPIIFTYYLNKADTLLEVPGLPDFSGIKDYLHDAEKYAIDNKMRQTVDMRLNNIERMNLLYKADVAMSKSTVASLNNAIIHLKSAQKLITNPTQEQEIQQKLNLATSLKAALEAKAPKKGK